MPCSTHSLHACVCVPFTHGMHILCVAQVGLSLGVGVACFGASLFPIILFDPDAIYSGAAMDAKFDGLFSRGELG